ncbi:DNA-processing protein DprA [Lyngbya sp. CCY1209]|uniref:DNA-processing protein DprA n=1 Tax=Lyngbya sp. CCY1209 TaxID=2886103 RepID=UPI002D1FCAF0|nr:DNA-processing protein DprA [Lyngbya sp. CCY1209]MEB3886616.1 DNA-processing protein DprA [Lyngbya sp. CCY1209]
MSEERVYWLAWSQISGIGPIALQRLQEQFGTLKAAWEAPAAELRRVEGFGKQTVEKVAGERSQLEPAQLFEKHLEKNPKFWTPADADYPRLLLEIPSPPPIVYYRGITNPDEIQGKIPTIAIVGTRNPTEYGRRWTRKISTTLTRSGFAIVSGMAAGIDTEAHRSCLDAGGRTLAVLGTGVDIAYPKENRPLCERVMESGLLISEFPSGTKPNARNFPRRNRIIAGLSRAVFVMEAPQRSGALITAHIANDFCRDVYVLPGRLDDEKSHGCLKLIDGGAGVIPVDLDQLLEQLGAIPQLDVPVQLPLFEPEPPPKSEPERPNLAPELLKILDAIAPEPTPFDLIVEQSGMDAGTVSGLLLQLELLGFVTQLPGMRYERK